MDNEQVITMDDCDGKQVVCKECGKDLHHFDRGYYMWIHAESNRAACDPTDDRWNSVRARPVPQVGMGVTMACGSDRSAGTIVKISQSGKTIWVQSDKAIRTDKNGMSESQTYEFTRQSDGPMRVITLRKNGRWVPKGIDLWQRGSGVTVGHRDAYYDFSF